MGYHNRNMRVNSINEASILRENFMKLGPVTPELTLLICERQLQHGQQETMLWQRDRATRLSVEILQLHNITFEN